MIVAKRSAPRPRASIPRQGVTVRRCRPIREIPAAGRRCQTNETNAARRGAIGGMSANPRRAVIGIAARRPLGCGQRAAGDGPCAPGVPIVRPLRRRAAGRRESA
ncbi:hypothetical protein WS65_26595 [Burkholderia anthina]|nr:hypothetical protein WS65_26595 [Burkholderia anthina]